MTFHLGAQKKKKKKPFSFPSSCGVLLVLSELSLIFRKGWSAYPRTDKTARSVLCCISREHVRKRKQNKKDNFFFVCFNLAELSNLEIQGRSACLYGQAVKGKPLCWLVFQLEQQLEVFSLASIRWKVCVSCLAENKHMVGLETRLGESRGGCTWPGLPFCKFRSSCWGQNKVFSLQIGQFFFSFL